MDYIDSSLGTDVTEHAGFPNPATDHSIISLDINVLLVKHPSSTFFMQLNGNAWEDRGIFDSDVIVIDRALEAKKTDLVVWWDVDEFRVSHFRSLPAKIAPWGVITSIIHRYRT